MTKVLVVISSARKGRVGAKVSSLVEHELSRRDNVEVSVADLKQLNLPYFDNEFTPSSPDYKPTDERVLTWQAMVAENDAIIFATPEYNHTLSAIQKNALDSLYPEWKDKPVAAIAYGWVGGARALTTLETVLRNLKTELRPQPAKLAFMKQLDPAGEVIDQADVSRQINATIDELLA